MKGLFRFNKSVRVEVRPAKAAGDARILLHREALSASGGDRHSRTTRSQGATVRRKAAS